MWWLVAGGIVGLIHNTVHFSDSAVDENKGGGAEGGKRGPERGMEKSFDSGPHSCENNARVQRAC